jgi:hypothetical protein
VNYLRGPLIHTVEFASYFRGEISADDFLAKAKLNNAGTAKDLLAVFDTFKEQMFYPMERFNPQKRGRRG